MTAKGSTVAVFFPGMGTAQGDDKGRRQSRQYQNQGRMVWVAD